MQNNSGFSVNHGMTRTKVEVPITGDPSVISKSVEELLAKEGYSLKPYNNAGPAETVWKKGIGFLTAMKFIKLDVQPNMLVIFGWTAAGLGSKVTSEMPLEGILGAAPKRACLKTVVKAAKLAQSIK